MITLAEDQVFVPHSRRKEGLMRQSSDLVDEHLEASEVEADKPLGAVEQCLPAVLETAVARGMLHDLLA